MDEQGFSKSSQVGTLQARRDALLDFACWADAVQMVLSCQFCLACHGRRARQDDQLVSTSAMGGLPPQADSSLQEHEQERGKCLLSPVLVSSNSVQ